MEIRKTGLPGVFLVEPIRREDERGFFGRTWCGETFARHGLCAAWVQSSVSFNRLAGTLRGLHWQAAPAEEAKLVRCTRGAVYDVAVDLRPGSPTRGMWISAELTQENRLALYIPAGVAHGFQTLRDDSEVFYEISCGYRPELQRGARWDDPALAIRWPDCKRRILSERDRSFQDAFAQDAPAG